jgi:hypothetical protein
MKLIVLSLLIIAGCSPQYILLTNDKGERVVCERPLGTHDGSFAQAYAFESRMSECVKAHEKIGFRRVDYKKPSPAATPAPQ